MFKGNYDKKAYRLYIMGHINDLSNLDDPTIMKEIATVVLKDTGMDDVLKPSDATSVRVEYGNIISDESRDALITVGFGPCSNLMAVYTLGENGYDFVGEVGYFNGVDNIRIVNPENSDIRMVLFRERDNQDVGALEKSGFLRGCTFVDGTCKKIFTTDENIVSWWNEGPTKGESDKWSKVEQISKFISLGDFKTINVEKHQTYSTAENLTSKIRPTDSDFVEQDERTITENYTWDDKWNVYLLDKMIDKKTGKEVAVIQDFANSPYALSGGNFDKYKILKDDGSMDIVDYSDLEEEPDSMKTDTDE